MGTQKSWLKPRSREETERKRCSPSSRPTRPAPVMGLTQLKSHCYTFPPDKSYFIKLKCKGISKTACSLHAIVSIGNLIHTPKPPAALGSPRLGIPIGSSGVSLLSARNYLSLLGAREGEKRVGACQNASPQLSFRGARLTPARRRTTRPGCWVKEFRHQTN